ncbi:MAG: NAD-dependent epimerase/dehydratase family protein, partial [Crenarchaeota archaeon]|nr:NAD-dependent epimerase/dehydratase family protein [Thermoproteota archaeon]
QSLYGISKNALRNCTELLAKQNNAIFQWIRAYYIVGNSQFGSSIFSKITKAEQEGKEKFPFTTGINQWDFIDYDELCKQISAIVEQNEVNGIINDCSGRPEKLADRVERFIKENGYSIQLDYGKFPDRPYDSKAVWGDDTKIREIMGRKK